ncbi:MAG: TonB-dependent receptor [Planctomycetota bacterium]
MSHIRQGCRFAIAMLIAVQSIGFASAEDPEFRMLQFAEDLEYGLIRPAQFEGDDLFAPSNQEPVGLQGIQPLDVDTTADFSGDSLGELPGEFRITDWSLVSQPSLSSDTSSLIDSASFLEELEQAQGTSEVSLTEAPAVDIVTPGAFNLTTPPDVTETLTTTTTTQTIKARRRSSVGFDLRVRGLYTGQVYAMHDTSYQFPVRSDLDGVFSKIDSALIGNVQIISGPYSVKYGSGFAFLNVDTIPTPRYECGWENHLRMATNVRTNGGQTYNTATLYGGGESVGYFANVGYRKGSDYAAGDGLLVPSSYDTFNLFSGLGWDLDRNTRSELRYTRIDQADTEYAGQFFDVDDLTSDGITHSLIHRNERTGFAYRVDTWANYTEFNGDTAADGKRRTDFPVLQRVDNSILGISGVDANFNLPPDSSLIPGQFFGGVDGDLISAGTRAGITKEIDRDRTVGFGADFRYMRQEIDEVIDVNSFTSNGGISGLGAFDGGVPTAEVFEPGLYAEYSFALRDYIQTATGVRVGFANTQADPNDVDDDSNFRNPFDSSINRDLDVADVLTSVFLTNEVELSPMWSARLGVGYAERVPTLEQRYSDGTYIAVIQNGFSRVIGDPSLSKERNWQFDAQLRMDSEFVRGRFSAFHSWIVDYVTYQANLVDPPLGAQLLQAINTEYATLTGFEYYCEADLIDGVQAFGSLAFLDGRDREINQPLPGINPLEGRAGLRWRDISAQNNWGVEWGLRMVDNQDRLGTLRAVSPATEPLTLETATPGFTTSYLRAFFRPTNNVNVTVGAENLFDNNYFEHLNLRLPADPNPPVGINQQTAVLSPGLTPYFGVEVEY